MCVCHPLSGDTRIVARTRLPKSKVYIYMCMCVHYCKKKNTVKTTLALVLAMKIIASRWIHKKEDN